MLAPGSRIGPASEEERATIMSESLLGRIYNTPVDRESAYEILLRRAAESQSATTATPDPAAAPPGGPRWGGALNDFLFGSTGPRGGRRDGLVQTVVKSSARSVTNQLLRGILGSLLKTKRR